MSGEWVHLEEALNQLSHGGNRLDGLETVRDLMSYSNVLPPGPLQKQLFSIANACAADPTPRVSNQWMQFLHELDYRFGTDSSSSQQAPRPPPAAPP
eukprot:CAMPEP_0113710892 /NCGR_PEP_ID=MMETSP0038_2-20120614/30427_1 /TAXON_ID=2898 /ORGANISM="Cryptomonas paramecium" /LENGTH=96 /DNA_ID=CAMNT_0000637035 /DNA_START=82 /DNA_END=368 /DNA_ORIENTATION=+ /assembly_acc=CAM_ASM_000170